MTTKEQDNDDNTSNHRAPGGSARPDGDRGADTRADGGLIVLCANRAGELV